MQELRGQLADHEVALAGGPDRHLAVLTGAHHRGVRLDVALVDGFHGVLALDDDVRLREPGVDVAELVDGVAGDVGGPVGRIGQALGAHRLVQHRRVVAHGVADVQDRRQHVVLDGDRLGGLFGLPQGGRRHRGDRVAVIERLVLRHHVARQVGEVGRGLARLGDADRRRREVRAGDHGLDAGHRFRLRGVDREDARVRVRAAHELRVQHAGQRQVGAVVGVAGDLVQPVVTDRPRAQDLVRAVAFGAVLAVRVCHVPSPPTRLPRRPAAPRG